MSKRPKWMDSGYTPPSEAPPPGRARVQDVITVGMLREIARSMRWGCVADAEDFVQLVVVNLWFSGALLPTDTRLVRRFIRAWALCRAVRRTGKIPRWARERSNEGMALWLAFVANTSDAYETRVRAMQVHALLAELTPHPDIFAGLFARTVELSEAGAVLGIAGNSHVSRVRDRMLARARNILQARETTREHERGSE